MNGLLVQAGGAGGGGTAPAIPGLEQGNPAVSNRPVQAPANPAAPGAPGTLIMGTPEQIRNQIRDVVREAARDGTMPVINLPSDFIRNAVPTGAVDIASGFFFMIAFIVVGLPLARAFGRRMDARSQALTSGNTGLRPAIDQLQQSVDAMSIEMERITEAQRFQAKLLTDRPKEQVRLER